VTGVELHRDGPVAWREARPDGDQTGIAVVCVHGFPQSSRMWTGLMEALAERGHRAVAPDLYALGDSADFGAATFEHTRERFAEWIDSLDLGRIVLIVHDWGGFVGLAWACEHPERIEALVISDSGFFADGKWHGMAEGMRSDQGEALVGALEREGFATVLNGGREIFGADDVDAYWAPFADNGRGQRATLEFYRSMDFPKLAPWQGKLGELGAPTLLLWGADDPFAPLAGARRFQREIPGAKLVAIEGAGHFVIDEERERCIDEILAFLDG